MDYKKAVYETVKRIPKGRVSTYGKISKQLKTQMSKVKTTTKNLKLKITPRMVGYALHNNPDPENIPCHRVVDRNGKLSENFAFGGWREQKRKLLAEGVKFKDRTHVDFLKNSV